MVNKLKTFMPLAAMLFIGVSYSGAYFSDSVSISNNTFSTGDLNPPVVVEVGEIIITEFMANPAAVSDSLGEYFEIYNSSSSDINLKGWRYRDNGIGNWNLISEDLIISAGSYLVFVASDNSLINGGIAGGYKFASSFNITNTKDEILIQKPDGNGGWIEVDRIAYDKNDIDWDIVSGISNQLKDLSSDNLDTGSWNLSTTEYGVGDLGTPGGPNV